jgi:hypothetical protein
MLQSQHFLEKTPVAGMAEKAKEFLSSGAEIYHGNFPEGASKPH